MRFALTLKLHPHSPWMELELHSDFLGNATEWCIRMALPGRSFDHGFAEIPFGTVERGAYPREFTRSEWFPAPDFVAFDRYIWMNSGTVAHAFRDGGLENRFQRSPVTRWAPWFPVTPETSMWDNGPRCCRFAFCADSSRYSAADRHRLGVEFQLAAHHVRYRAAVPAKLTGLPESVVPAGKDAAGNWWLFEAAGKSCDWEARQMHFLPRQIRKEKLA